MQAAGMTLAWLSIGVITVDPASKASFVYCSMQARLMGQYVIVNPIISIVSFLVIYFYSYF